MTALDERPPESAPTRPLRPFILLFSLALCGCEKLGLPASDSQAPTFGGGYDECILKNLRGSQANAAEIEQSCRRHFETTATSSVITSTATISPYSYGNDAIEFVTKNTTNTGIVTRYNLSVEFYDSEHTGAADDKSKMVSSLYWEWDGNIEPYGSETMTGSFVGGKAPTRHPYVVATTMREIRLR